MAQRGCVHRFADVVVWATHAVQLGAQVISKVRAARQAWCPQAGARGPVTRACSRTCSRISQSVSQPAMATVLHGVLACTAHGGCTALTWGMSCSFEAHAAVDRKVQLHEDAAAVLCWTAAAAAARALPRCLAGRRAVPSPFLACSLQQQAVNSARAATQCQHQAAASQASFGIVDALASGPLLMPCWSTTAYICILLMVFEPCHSASAS